MILDAFSPPSLLAPQLPRSTPILRFSSLLRFAAFCIFCANFPLCFQQLPGCSSRNPFLFMVLHCCRGAGGGSNPQMRFLHPAPFVGTFQPANIPTSFRSPKCFSMRSRASDEG